MEYWERVEVWDWQGAGGRGPGAGSGVNTDRASYLTTESKDAASAVSRVACELDTGCSLGGNQYAGVVIHHFLAFLLVLHMCMCACACVCLKTHGLAASGKHKGHRARKGPCCHCWIRRNGMLSGSP